MSSFSRSIVAALALALTQLASPTCAQNDLGQVKPQYRYEKSVIAVAPFPTGGTGINVDEIPRIVRNDLELSGFFSNVADQRQANSLNQRDVKERVIHFGDWAALGAEQYLMGNVTVEGDVIKCQILMYDIADQKLVINQVASDNVRNVRGLAHQISDVVVKYTQSGLEGVSNTKMLFVTEQVPGVREIAICDADGFNARKLTSFGKIATTPTWGANGTELYFTSYHGNRAKIYGMLLKLDANFQIQPGDNWVIAPYGGTNHTPSWGPAAGRLAMVLSKDGNSEIYSAKRDGTDLRRLTQTKFTEGSPAWSPDGSKVAFTSNEAGGVHLFMMNADGSGKRRVTTRGSWNDSLSWSPDGRHLAFVNRAGGVNDIYVCDASGSEDSYRRLTMGQGSNDNPTWAADSVHLAFSSNRSGSWQIFVMLDDGSNQKQITTSGKNMLPDWGPLRGKKAGK